jgi:hypothetical protein
MAFTVGELKKLIADLDDKTIILRGSYDHSYERSRAIIGQAECVRGSYYFEYHGPEHMADGGVVIQALIVN